MGAGGRRLSALAGVASLAAAPAAFAADATPPVTPVVSDDGAYTASATRLHAAWSSSDPESGIAEYRYLIRRDSPAGPILVSWTSRGTATSVTRKSLTLQQGRTYVFGVKAKNGAGRWSAVGYTDGITVDTTAPSAVSVTDDGAVSLLRTQLHAAWTPSSDPESGIAEYQYRIRVDSPSGSTVVGFTSIGTATEVTRTGLSLVVGKTYYVGVRAKNGAGRYSSTRYADGITMQADASPPTGTLTVVEGELTNAPVVTFTLHATDNSGVVSQMRFSSDGVTYSTPEPYASSRSWTLAGGDGMKMIAVEFGDPNGNWSAPVSDMIGLDTEAPGVVIVYPPHGLLLGGGS